MSIHLLRGYIFADRFMVTNFRRAMNNTLVDYLENVNRLHTVFIIPEAYANIPADRPILELLVDIYCQWDLSGPRRRLERIHQLPHAFLVRAFRRMNEIHFYGGKTYSNSRCYQEHASKEEKTACSKVHMRYCSETELGYFSQSADCKRCKKNDDQDNESEEQSGSHSDSD
jgi:hypothetical protein